jgi:hypothetical protein
MVEEAPANWQDETLGDKLMEMFKVLLTLLAKKKLSNYFIRKQNMFDAVPKHKLAKAHERLFRINENIVPHLIQAVKYLQSDKGFYPPLDSDRLIEILTVENVLTLVLPPMLQPPSKPSSVER